LVMATIKEYFQTAQREKATDIYFSVGSPPFLKINGGLHPLKAHPDLNKTKIDGLAQEVLSPRDLSEFESRREIISACTIDGLGRLRVVLSDESRGLCLACRLLPLNIPEFDGLGLPSFLKKMVSSGTGLILIIGCAKSGKTTTLASLIQHINDTSEKSILTMEVPTEYEHENNRSFIEQMRLPGNGTLLNKRTYSNLLKTADVMVMDGLPLEETMIPALNAAAEGLLVLATLETNGGVAEVLTRIVHNASANKRGSGRKLLAHTLRCAIWQHLLPLKNGSGFTPAVEILINDPVVSRLISQERSLHLLRPTMAAGRYKGMQTMHQALEALKQQSLVHKNILAAFKSEILRYYVSPIKGSF